MPDQTQNGETPPAIDHRRRALLVRLCLASGAAWVAPALTARAIARADDDGDDDDDRGSGRDGGEAAPRRAAPRRAAPPDTLPELVLLVPPGTAPDPLAAAGYRVLGLATVAGATLLRVALAPGRSPAQARAEVSALLPGALADVNHLYAPDAFLCDPEGCDAAAMIGWTGRSSGFAPRIGMIDTGINLGHPALAGQRVTVVQADLGERAAAGRQHGTAVAALLVGRADQRVPGLLPLADLVAVEAFHALGGVERADAFALVQGIDRLIAADVAVINMSFSGPENAVLRQVVGRAATAGVGMVAAAGNSGPGAPPAYPAAWPEVVAVTAVDARRRAYRQANRGPWIALAAPGVNLWTAASVSGGRLRSGTSYAAPFVTATLAVERLRNPALPMAEVVAGVIACAADLGEAGFDPVFGHGLVSAPGHCAGGAPYLTSGSR